MTSPADGWQPRELGGNSHPLAQRGEHSIRSLTAKLRSPDVGLSSVATAPPSTDAAPPPTSALRFWPPQRALQSASQARPRGRRMSRLPPPADQDSRVGATQRRWPVWRP